MPNVQMPDGAIVAFPDDMPREQIRALIAGKFPDMAPAAPNAQPGSQEYAVWAAQQVRAGNAVPQVSGPPPEQPQPTSFLDQINAGTTAAFDAVPIVGPSIKSGMQSLKAGVWGIPQDRIAAEDAGREQANPVARTTGMVAGTVLPFVGAGAIPGIGRLLGLTGGLGSRIGFGAASGGLISAADAKVRGASDAEAGVSGGIGAALGGALPVAARGIQKLITPFASAPGRTAAAQVLEREGVTLSAGQRTGSKKLQYLESELGGGAADALMERQGREFTAAVLRRAGVAADTVEPHVIDQAFEQIGQQFDDLAARNTIRPDARMMNDLGQVWQDYSQTVAQGQRAPLVQSVVADLANRVNSGQAIDGAFYKATRSRLDRAARSTRDPELQTALRDINAALDEAMERTIAVSNPADLGAWRAVRSQYRNMLVIEKAATGAGPQSASGVVTPARLRSAAIAQNRRAYARGRNDFTDLANAAVETMTPLPQSGTAPRFAARLPLPLGGATGAGIGGTLGGLPGAAVGGLVGAALPWAAGRAALSAPGRAMLSNQMLANMPRGLLAPAAPGLLSERRRPIEITVGR